MTESPRRGGARRGLGAFVRSFGVREDGAHAEAAGDLRGVREHGAGVLPIRQQAGGTCALDERPSIP